jgi:hypothetical protein
MKKIIPTALMILSMLSVGWHWNPIYATPVTKIESHVNLNIRTHPSLDGRVVGRLYWGRTAWVTGISRDKQWWRIRCGSGSCFVSANPNYTQPISWRW